MKIFEKYRTTPSGIRPQTARESAKEILKGVRHDPGNTLDSSVTLPNWQAARLEHAVRILQAAGIKTPRTRIFSTVIRLSQRKLRRLECQIHRTKRRNTKVYSYKKISHQWPQDDYNLLHGRADHAKVSASYLLDLALRLYLRAAVAILPGHDTMLADFKRSNGNERITKEISLGFFRKIMEFSGIYQRKTPVSTPWRVKFRVGLGSPPKAV